MEDFENLNEVELATKQVKSYQRRGDDGKVYTVRAYTAYVKTDMNSVIDRARQSPGRPTMSAGTGNFPGGRSIPVWPDAGKSFKAETREDGVDYEELRDTGKVDQAALDREVPAALAVFQNLPQNAHMKKLVSILRGLSTASLSDFDPLGIVELAHGSVSVEGYSYIHPKTGKLVRVNPYVQMRNLVNSLGGPAMASRRGVTSELLTRAFPELDVKGKVYGVRQNTDKGAARIQRARSKSPRATEALAEINRLPVDREFDISAPKDGEDFMKRAMSPQHPLESVRSAAEGSVVTRGKDTWTRGLDGLWYRTPRKNNKGISDKQLTKNLASKKGVVSLSQGNPVQRKMYPLSKPDYDTLNPRSANYTDAVRFTKSLEPTLANVPEGVTDSLNGNIEVVKTSSRQKNLGPTHISSTKANNYLPKLVFHPNPEHEADIISSLPKQQREGYSVPTTLHPMEAVAASSVAGYVESLMEARAPQDMVDRMYDRLSSVYDKHIKDGGDYSGLTGKTGWEHRLRGERSAEVRDIIADKLSGSSLRSPQDFLAEAWTEYVGSATPRPLSKDMGQAYQKGMEEFSDYLFANKWGDASEIPERVYSKTAAKTLSRKVSDAIGGHEDRVVDTPLAPRELRSVINSNSKYVDVRDAEGNPLFDMEVREEGSTARLGGLVYPKAVVADMPSSTPSPDAGVVSVEPGARYYSTPMEDLAQDAVNKPAYAQYVDEVRAARAVEAVEESLHSKGIRRFEVEAKEGEDSVVYARSGYQFDPELVDAHVVSSMLNDIGEILDRTEQDTSDGFGVIPKKERAKMKRALTSMQSKMTHDYATWPTPQDIAAVGKWRESRHGIGEGVLDKYSWSGVKELREGHFPRFDNPSDVVKPVVPDHAYKRASAVSPPAGRSPVSKSNRVVRAIEESSSPEEFQEAAKELLSEVVEAVLPVTPKTSKIRKHKSPVMVDIEGDAKDYKVKVSYEQDTLFEMGVEAKQSDTVWSSPVVAPVAEAVAIASKAVEALEHVYQKSSSKAIVQRSAPGETSGYALAASGADWLEAPSLKHLSTTLKNAAKEQVDRSREALSIAEAGNARNRSTSDMYNSQRNVERLVRDIEGSIDRHIESLMAKYDSDPKGPMPYEVAQVGKREAIRVAQAVRSKATSEETYQTALAMLRRPLPADPSVPAQTASAELAEKVRKEREGTGLGALMDFDGDASHDSFGEFTAKQALTGGMYAFMKTMEGYWSWATDTQKSSARKESVGLLFILLRLLPASYLRGSLLMTANALTRRMKSPNPNDWPSKGEIDSLISSMKRKIPQDKLNELEA